VNYINYKLVKPEHGHLKRMTVQSLPGQSISETHWLHLMGVFLPDPLEEIESDVSTVIQTLLAAVQLWLMTINTKHNSQAHSCNCQLFSNAHMCITLFYKASGQVVILALCHTRPTIGWPSLESFILAPLSDRDLANRSKVSSGHSCNVL